jgi:TRAP transporter TAXI family solute receptor
MRKLIYLGLVLVLVGSLVIVGCAGEAQPAPTEAEITQVRYLGAPVGSDNFMIGALFANEARSELGMPCGAFPGGSAENIKLINAGDAELGYASCMDAYNGANGLSPFDQEYKKIRFLARHSTVSLAIAVKMDSDIQEISDLLEGKKLAVGTGGSTAELFSLYALEAGYGITPADIEAGGGVVAHLSYSEMGAGLADGTLDCVCLFTFPTKVASKLMAADEQFGVRLLPISDEAMTKISAAYPFIGRGYVNGGVYKGNAEQVTAISSNYIQITSSDLSDDLVYQIMDVLWSDTVQQKVVESCPACPDYALENTLREGSIVIPVHPGAAKWYQDQGMTLPPEAKVLP